MALIKCWECARAISDKAMACPLCGAPANGSPSSEAAPTARVAAHYDSSTDTFTGTMALMTKVAMSAVMRLGWKLTAANEAIGLVTFETRMSFGSWSGVSCSLSIEEVAPNRFRVSGSGKQNVRGGQLLAIDFFGEAKSKVDKAIAKMKDIAR
ncbi:hypothetical protein [Bradyrhizobium jicamae]|uniref:hypothetical protein n=1 Tax=Bradyrhizobium jicamae TaxID=280332 RepID=UPI001BA8A223|nr:hypothetical protein [Bradyrhizobium jicamae]MBR0936108.1 hypothetical protein [Bradyrhizobium jicamae]